MRNITFIVYGVMIGHFIRMAIRKMVTRCTGVEITFDYPIGDGHYPLPYLGSNGKWRIENGLLVAMKNQGMDFDYRTGSLVKDPAYVEPETAMPF